MKTTLVLDDDLARRLKQEAARRGRTMSELAATAIRELLDRSPPRSTIAELPSFPAGRLLADITDRDELYRVMEGT